MESHITVCLPCPSCDFIKLRPVFTHIDEQVEPSEKTAFCLCDCGTLITLDHQQRQEVLRFVQNWETSFEKNF